MYTTFPEKYLSMSCACVENSLSIEYDGGYPPPIFCVGSGFVQRLHARVML